MAYYQITLKIKNKKQLSVVRQYNNLNLEHIFVWLRSVSHKQYGDRLEKFNCVMISKSSDEARNFISSKGKPADTWELDDIDQIKSAEGYQPRKSKSEGPPLGDR